MLKNETIKGDRRAVEPYSISLLTKRYKAKGWLYNLPPSSIQTWADMQKQFLEKFFPTSRATDIQKEICGIRQFSGESLYEY